MSQKLLGKAWVILEESIHHSQKELISLISPRKSISFVADYIEQLYLDRFASFSEKIQFKKDKAASPYKLEIYSKNTTTIRHGHDPMFNAYYAEEMELKGENLIFHYRTLKDIQGHKTFEAHVTTVPIRTPPRKAANFPNLSEDQK